MRYNFNDIDLLLQELQIERVVGEFIELKKFGANYKGLCPFHKDNNPSFVVSPSKNICKCFVCGAGGNPIKFYSELKKISFNEAVNELALKYNVLIKENKNNNADLNTEYYAIMEKAHQFYKEEIFKNTSREALEYLSKREINPKLITENGIGYAPKTWTDLYDYLIKNGFENKKIFKLGLAKEGNNGVYDTFRNRIIFPIYSISGKIIAFGGRTLEENKDVPKYINSQETPIFIKGKNLYGFIQKGGNIKKKNYAILMEGYMDVLSAHSYGFDVSLAPLGTALTEEQVKLLKRYTNNVILSFDMDEAGQRATEKSIMMLKLHGFNIRILQYKNAKDPDDYLKKYGKDEFLKVVKNSLEAFDYLYLKYSQDYNLDDLMSKQNFIDKFKEFFQNLNNELEKSLYIDKLSKSLDIDIEILKDILIKKNKKKIKKDYDEVDRQNKIDKIEIDELEKITLSLLISYEKYYSLLKNKNIKSTLGKKIYSYLEFLEENEDKSKNISKDIIKFSHLTKDEQEMLDNISMLSIAEYSKEQEAEINFQKIYTSWFILELKNALKKREDIYKNMKLKKIEEKMKHQIKFNEIHKLYEEFIKIV